MPKKQKHQILVIRFEVEPQKGGKLASLQWHKATAMALLSPWSEIKRIKVQKWPKKRK